MLGAFHNGILASAWRAAASASSAKVKSGSYIGTAGVLHVTGVGFLPKLIIIKGTGSGANDDPVIMWSGMSDNSAAGPAAAVFSPSTAPATGMISSYDSDGFTLANNALVNTLASTYDYVAIGGSADDFIAVGSYAGNSTDNATPISGLTFAPQSVFIRRRNLNTAFVTWKNISMAGDSAFMLGNAATFTANAIQGFNATSVEIGTSNNVNTAGATYDWVCLGPSSNAVYGSYTGNSIDNSNLVSGMTFQPDWVFVKGNINKDGVMRGTVNAGDDSSILSNSTANAANWIQVINSDGFQLGTNAGVNSATTAYHYIALKST